MPTSLKLKSNVTLFTTCKPWRGDDAAAQWNAIKSWTLLHPRPTIVVFGDDYGSRRMTGELEVLHRPGVARHRNGPPYLHALFRDAQAMATTSLACYINADIILVRGFMEMVEAVHARFTIAPFMVVGQRWDVPTLTGQTLNFGARWQERLEQYARSTGALHGPAGLDWFLFRRGTVPDLAPYIVGKAAWDNYLLLTAGRKAFETVDATDAVLAVHQADSPQTPDALWYYNNNLWQTERPRHGEGTTDSCLWTMSANLNITEKQGGTRDAHTKGRR